MFIKIRFLSTMLVVSSIVAVVAYHPCLAALLDPTPKPLNRNSAITENPALGATEEWAIDNHTEDAHPIHLHMVMFRVIKRIDTFGERTPEPWETGWKDTVIAYPSQRTVIQATFDKAGLFLWHCHILEHEDNEMMRPYFVGPMP